MLGSLGARALQIEEVVYAEIAAVGNGGVHSDRVAYGN
jgi:hypothetical protein